MLYPACLPPARAAAEEVGERGEASEGGGEGGAARDQLPRPVPAPFLLDLHARPLQLRALA
jgi:hypothetical protein